MFVEQVFALIPPPVLTTQSGREGRGLSHPQIWDVLIGYMYASLTLRLTRSYLVPQHEAINVNIQNVINWFRESEQCMLHNHAERIPNSLETNLNEKMLNTLTTTAKWHANLQIEFWRELMMPDAQLSLRK